MNRRVQAHEHPPRVPLDNILVRFGTEAASVVAAWHANLRELHDDHPYIDSDVFDIWCHFTNVPFHYTLPTFTVSVDGKPQTFDDTVTQLERVKQATRCINGDEVS